MSLESVQRQMVALMGKGSSNIKGVSSYMPTPSRLHSIADQEEWFRFPSHDMAECVKRFYAYRIKSYANALEYHLDNGGDVPKAPFNDGNFMRNSIAITVADRRRRLEEHLTALEKIPNLDPNELVERQKSFERQTQSELDSNWAHSVANAFSHNFNAFSFETDDSSFLDNHLEIGRSMATLSNNESLKELVQRHENAQQLNLSKHVYTVPELLGLGNIEHNLLARVCADTDGLNAGLPWYTSSHIIKAPSKNTIDPEQRIERIAALFEMKASRDIDNPYDITWKGDLETLMSGILPEERESKIPKVRAAKPDAKAPAPEQSPEQSPQQPLEESPQESSAEEKLRLHAERLEAIPSRRRPAVVDEIDAKEVKALQKQFQANMEEQVAEELHIPDSASKINVRRQNLEAKLGSVEPPPEPEAEPEDTYESLRDQGFIGMTQRQRDIVKEGVKANFAVSNGAAVMPPTNSDEKLPELVSQGSVKKEAMRARMHVPRYPRADPFPTDYVRLISRTPLRSFDEELEQVA